MFSALGSTLRGGDQGAPIAAAPAGSRIYAIGDIHGRVDLLRNLHRLILRDAVKSDVGRFLVVYLGDYIDRGPDSRAVVDLLIDDPLAGFETVHLIGNHEAYLMQFLEDNSIASHWMTYGGDTTLESYGIDLKEPTKGQTRADQLQERLLEALPQSHLDFYRSLVACHSEGGYFFAHAGVRPGVALEDQDLHDLMWIREPFLRSRVDLGKVVVHGHTPVEEPELRSNRIGIDTGAVYGGPLTALVLEGMTMSFIQV